MEKFPDLNVLKIPVAPEVIEGSVETYIQELRNESTGRYSRAEYIRILDEILSDRRYRFSLGLSEVDDLAMVELCGQSLAGVRLVSVDNESETLRGDLAFEGVDQKVLSTLLPDDFSVKAQYLQSAR